MAERGIGRDFKSPTRFSEFGGLWPRFSDFGRDFTVAKGGGIGHDFRSPTRFSDFTRDDSTSGGILLWPRRALDTISDL